VIEPVWLSAETVIYINKRTVQQTGEPFFLRDPAMLESALGKPKNQFDYGYVEDVASLATTLLFGIARNHPFEQGNKRTGFLSAVAFLENNGHTFGTIDEFEEIFGFLIVDVINGLHTDGYFADFLRRHLD
jgi:death on curing protein